jgi:hypothetical protein
MEKPHNLNPVSKLWQRLGYNVLLLSKLLEYMKLVHIAITIVLDLCKDKKTFFTLSYLNNKMRNRLQGNLDTCIKIFS